MADHSIVSSVFIIWINSHKEISSFIYILNDFVPLILRCDVEQVLLVVLEGLLIQDINKLMTFYWSLSEHLNEWGNGRLKNINWLVEGLLPEINEVKWVFGPHPVRVCVCVWWNKMGWHHIHSCSSGLSGQVVFITMTMEAVVMALQVLGLLWCHLLWAQTHTCRCLLSFCPNTHSTWASVQLLSVFVPLLNE